MSKSVHLEVRISFNFEVRLGQVLPEWLYRGTSLIRKRTALAPYSRPIPRVQGVSYWGGRFLMGEMAWRIDASQTLHSNSDWSRSLHDREEFGSDRGSTFADVPLSTFVSVGNDKPTGVTRTLLPLYT